MIKLPMVLAMVDSNIVVSAPPTICADLGDGRLSCVHDECGLGLGALG